MAYEITHIRMSDTNNSGTERIKEVKLSNDTVETVEFVAECINLNMKYYYTNSCSSRAKVEAVFPENRKPYIRTENNGTQSDNLLNLPKF